MSILILTGSVLASTLGAQDSTESENPGDNSAVIDDGEALQAFGWLVSIRSGFNIGFTDEELNHIIKGIELGAKSGAEPTQVSEKIDRARQIFEARKEAYDEIKAIEDASFAEKNAKTIKNFIAKLEMNPAIQKTESGLYYEILEEGIGRMPDDDETVKIHYHGTMLDGNVFDSSVERGNPITYAVSGFVPGFREGLQLVREGGKIRLFIVPELGYGKKASGPIPAGSMLVFEVELLEVDPVKTTTIRPE